MLGGVARVCFPRGLEEEMASLADLLFLEIAPENVRGPMEHEGRGVAPHEVFRWLPGRALVKWRAVRAILIG